jgi:hypothetical protein
MTTATLLRVEVRIKPPNGAKCADKSGELISNPVMRLVRSSCAASFLRRLFPAGMAATACLACAGAGSAPPTTGPVVELPTFTVVETRILPPPESWRYAQVTEFDILSDAPDGTTELLVHDFLLFHRAVETVWPTARMNAEVAASLILCRSARTFAEFVPANVIPDAERTLSLSIQDRENAAVVINLQDSGPAEQAGMSGFSRKLLHDEYVHFVVGRIGPRTPPWLETALVKLFGAMVCDENEIGLPASSDPDMAARRAFAAAKPGPGLLANDKAFQTAVRAGTFMPLGQLFAADAGAFESGDSSATPEAREAYEFVHLCLFGARQEYRPAFLNFAYLAAREPVTEALFRRCFNKSYDEMLAVLWGYADFGSNRAFKLQDREGRVLAEIPALALREATDAESARVRGEAQRMAGRTDEARRSLIAPYVRGSRDPELLAALGLAELSAGRDDRARRFLDAAIGARTNRARAYVEFARLGFLEAAARPSGAGGRLGIDQITTILRPLFAARALRPPLPDVYELIAETWSRASVAPTSGNLGAVDEGVQLFPYDMDLVYADAILHAHWRRNAAAASLCDIGLMFAPDEGTRERFRGLKDSLSPVVPNNPPR